jgi:tetratricopeptide (TPR) repeat protein
MEDGTAPPEPAGIESVCGTIHSRTLVYTDSKGGFSLGSGMSDVADARSPGRGGASTSAVGVPRNITSGLSPKCRIRATLPGYRSTEVDMALRMRGDPTPLTIVLHPMAKVEGRTISATSIDAPKEARAAFDKAGRAISKKKWGEAEKQLEKAVQAYPRYAAAWSDLGNAYSERGEGEKARMAYRQAVEIDPKFINPWLGLAQLAMHEKKWDEMAALTARLIKMDPYDVPAAYALDAMANLNLNNLEAAEKRARQGLEIDGAGEVPKIEHLLGVVLMRKREFRAAAEHLNKYLKAAPDAPDAEFVRRQLAACEKAGA